MTHGAVRADAEHPHGQHGGGVRARHHGMQAGGRVEGGDAAVVAAVAGVGVRLTLLPGVVLLAGHGIRLLVRLILDFLFEFSLQTK